MMLLHAAGRRSIWRLDGRARSVHEHVYERSVWFLCGIAGFGERFRALVALGRRPIRQAPDEQGHPGHSRN